MKNIMQCYEVVRTRTAKAIGMEDYQCWDNERKQFATLAEVKSFLHEEYGKCKKSPFYYDDKDGTTHRGGVLLPLQNAASKLQ